MSVAQDKTMCETPSVAVVIIDAGSLFAEGLDLEKSENLDAVKLK